MFSAVSEIPQEIIDLVTDQTQSDPATLQALSLVSKAWSLRTREYLFHSIELDREARCTRGTSLFEERPLLRHWVKALTIRVNSSEGPFDFWLNKSKSIFAILPLLDSLSHFSVRGDYSRGGLHWRALLPDVQVALYEVMAMPHVTSITLSQILKFDIVPLTQYGHLQELVLDDVRYVTVPDPVEHDGACLPRDAPSSSPSIPVQPRLRLLDFVYCPETFQALLVCSKRREATGFNLSDLTHLKVTVSDLYIECKDVDWNSLFVLCAASIESYTFYQGAHRNLSPSIIPLHRFPNLKEVFWRIEYKTGESREGSRKSFPIFVGALDKFSRADYEAHYLATIRVEYDGCAEYIKEELNELLVGQRWRWLDEILQRPAFSNLREVKFVFTVRCCRSRGDILSKKGWGEHSGCI